MNRSATARWITGALALVCAVVVTVAVRHVPSDSPAIVCPGHDAPAQVVVRPEGRLVFTSGSGPCIGIYSSNPDGSDLRRLTRAVNGYVETGPRWSPDGRRIAFVGECGQPRSDLCVMNADGTAQTTVVARLNNAAPPTWSPDGTRLAFARTPPTDARTGVTPESEIHVIRTDGTGETTVVKDGHAPSWSPDGTRIAFVRGRETVASIYLVNPDGTGLVRLTEGPFDEVPTWSPDGSRVVFTSGRAGKPEFMTDYARQVLRSGKESILTDPNRPVRPANDVYVMGADGTGIARLTSDPSDNVQPAWSPDGDRIVFSSSRDGDYDLYVMLADGTGPVQVMDIPDGDTNASWAGPT